MLPICRRWLRFHVTSLKTTASWSFTFCSLNNRLSTHSENIFIEIHVACFQYKLSCLTNLVKLPKHQTTKIVDNRLTIHIGILFNRLASYCFSFLLPSWWNLFFNPAAIEKPIYVVENLHSTRSIISSWSYWKLFIHPV